MAEEKPRMDAMIEEKINVFIPARALEHVCNSEFATRDEKIQWAIRRYYLNKDFFNPRYERPAPYVFLDKILFKNDPLGYAVKAIIRVDKPVQNECV